MHMQASNESKPPTKNRLVSLAIAVMLLLGGTTFGVLWLREIQAHNLTRGDLQDQIASLDERLVASNETARTRLAELEHSHQEQETLRQELEDVRSRAELLTAQLAEARTETESQTNRADAAEKQAKIEADRAEIGRRMLSTTFFNLRSRQRTNPQYASEELVTYVAAQIKSIARRKAPEAEAAARHELGWILSQQDLFDRAAKQTQIAVDLRRESLGPTHPDTLKSLYFLGNALALQGNSEDAIDAHREALSGMREVYAAEPDRIRLQLGYLADALNIARRFEEAIPVLEELVRLKRAASSGRFGGSRYSQFSLAKSLQAVGQYDRAESLLRKLLASDMERSGPDHGDTFESTVRLVWVLRIQDKHEEADRLEKKFASLVQFMVEIKQPFTDDSYGSYLAYMGRFEEAEFYLTRRYEGRKRARDDGASMNQHVYPLIELYEAWDKPDLAEEFRQLLVIGPSTGSR